MAYKDEYEIARLYTDSDFLSRVADQFDGPYRLRFHLAPPLVAERDLASGHLKKREYGSWMLTAFRILVRLKGLRGTPFDIFGHSAERRTERQAIADYETLLDEITANLTSANHQTAVELAQLPLEIRGFGHVKEANRQHAAAKTEALLTGFRTAPDPQSIAAE
jgi:indolepyruvate ferredoxin oxidoreductase